MRLRAVRINGRAFERGGYAQNLPREQQIRLVEEALAIWSETKKLGQSLIARL
jgi:hypothetical protein